MTRHAAGLRAGSEQHFLPDDGEWLDVVLRAVPTAPFRGIVLDDATGLSIPNLSVHVEEAGGPSEVCTTDSEGAFTSSVEFAAGSMWVTPWDNGWAPVGSDAFLEHAIGGDTGPTMCRVVPGELHSLRTTPILSDVDDYVLQVWPRDMPPSPGYLLARPAVLHAGDPPWFRLHGPTDDGPETLHLLARDGFSGARIDLPVGSDVELRLGPRGALWIDVRESLPTPARTFVHEDGREESRPSIAFENGADVRFSPLPEGTSDRLPFVVGVLPGRREHVKWIDPGRWRCRIGSAYYGWQTKEIEVVAHRTGTLDAFLGPVLPTETIRVTVEEEAGDVPVLSTEPGTQVIVATVLSLDEDGEGFYIVSRSLCGYPGARFRRVERDGRFVYETLLEDVPLGAYRIELWTGESDPVLGHTVQAGESVTFTLGEAP